MKKLVALLTALLLCLPLMTAFAAGNMAYVTITDDTGALVVAYAPVPMIDADKDGVVTIAEVLRAAHAYYHADAVNGFAMEETAYGLSLTRLWGIENGGAYGYYVNDASAWSLLEPVQAGDHVKAFCYTDLTAWSDTYCFFAAPTATVEAGAALTLTLSAAGYDETWAPVTLPVAGAVITVDGEATDVVTDENGVATITLTTSGLYIISAVHADITLVAPICVASVPEVAAE